MTTKQIAWIGPERFLPDIGEVRPDRVLDLEEAVADSYIRQGLAKELRPAATEERAKVKPRTKDEEVN